MENKKLYRQRYRSAFSDTGPASGRPENDGGRNHGRPACRIRSPLRYPARPAEMQYLCKRGPAAEGKERGADKNLQGNAVRRAGVSLFGTLDFELYGTLLIHGI